MPRIRLAIAGLLLVLSTGCLTSGPGVASRIEGMQRELRYHEDLIYDLDYENEKLCIENQRLKARLERCQRDAEAAKEKAKADSPPRLIPGLKRERLVPPKKEMDDGPRIVPESATEPERAKRPGSVLKGSDADSPSAEDMPKGGAAGEDASTDVDIGPTKSKSKSPAEQPFQDEEDIPAPAAKGRAPEEPPVEPEAEPEPAPGVRRPGARPPVGSGTQKRSRRARTHADEVSPRGLRVIASGTHGVDLDEQPGDEAVAIVVEPLDREGEFIDAVGTVRVVVSDPALVGSNSQVVACEFGPDDLLDCAAVDPSSNGYRLEIPFTQGPPRHDRLRVNLVFIAADGSEHETATEIIVRRAKYQDVAARVARQQDPSRQGNAPTERETTRAVDFESEEVLDDWSPRPDDRAEPIERRFEGSRAAAPRKLETSGNERPSSGAVPSPSVPARKSRPGWSPNR